MLCTCGSKGIRMDASHQESDPERILLGLSNHEPASSDDRSSVQQSNAIGHEYVFDRSSMSHHTDDGGGFRLAGARAHSILTRLNSGTFMVYHAYHTISRTHIITVQPISETRS